MKELPNPLKYQILEEKIDIKDDHIQKYMEALKELISYQHHMIKEQRSEIIALKHKQAWKRYDLPDSKFEPSVDKPSKCGNMSC